MIKAALISDPVFSSPLFQDFAQVLLLVFYFILFAIFIPSSSCRREDSLCLS